MVFIYCTDADPDFDHLTLFASLTLSLSPFDLDQIDTQQQQWHTHLSIHTQTMISKIQKRTLSVVFSFALLMKFKQQHNTHSLTHTLCNVTLSVTDISQNARRVPYQKT